MWRWLWRRTEWMHDVHIDLLNVHVLISEFPPEVNAKNPPSFVSIVSAWTNQTIGTGSRVAKCRKHEPGTKARGRHLQLMLPRPRGVPPATPMPLMIEQPNARDIADGRTTRTIVRTDTRYDTRTRRSPARRRPRRGF